ncbi:MAG: type II secretion system protein [Pseudomonadota bacterium]
MTEKIQIMPRNNRGFSLVEFAIVVVIAGFLLVTGLGLYSAYINDQRVLETYDKQRAIISSIRSFSTKYQRLPCPADPTIAQGEPGFGEENCLLPFISGARDTPADGNTSMDPVLVGTIPITSLRSTALRTNFKEASLDSISDPWGYQMTYAVSRHLTSASSYNSEFGAIGVEAEDGTSLTEIPNSAHYVILSHGNNHAGAYTMDGIQTTPCTAGTIEAENCNGDAVFVNGILSRGNNSNYYDDIINYQSHSISGLWEFTGQDIYNKNLGNIGVGKANPEEKLDVNGNVRAKKLTAKELCSDLGSNCWSPANIASPAGVSCTGTPSPGYVFVTKEIVGGDVVCIEAPKLTVNADQSCDPGELVVGFKVTGEILCETF